MACTDLNTAVDARIAAALSAYEPPPGEPGPPGSPLPEVPAWDHQTGSDWPAFQARLQDDAARFSKLPFSTCGKTNLTATFPATTNLISAALSLPERRHYLTPHTGSPGYARVADIQTLQNAQQEPHLGSGGARTNGAVLFPDGEVMPVPSCSTSIQVLTPTTESGRTLATAAPGNYAFCGGALWADGVSALFAPHTARHPWLVNKNTGAVTVLTGYTFAGTYACAGVRRVHTGEYLFVPHDHTKFVLLDPATLVFRELPFTAPGAESYVDCTTLNTGEVYVAAHKAPCSVVIDVVAGTKLDTLPPLVGAAITPAWANFRTCKRLADGRVALVPFKHSKCWVYERATNRHTQAPGTYPEGAVACASMAEFGDVFLWPWNLGIAYKLAAGYGVPVDPQIVCSPLFNGF